MQYTVRTQRGGYRVIKFDFLLNVECVYNVTGRNSCDCHQGFKHTCRHRRMVDLFNHLGRTDRGFFYCYDTQTWSLPLTEAYQSIKRRRSNG